MNAIRFTITGRPVPQGSVRIFRGRIVQRREVLDWRARAALAARAAYPNLQPIIGPVTVVVRFVFARPGAHYSGRDRAALKPWAVNASPGRPDLDKLVRALCDALVDGNVIDDDSQVRAIVARKVYGSPARSEVRLWW